MWASVVAAHGLSSCGSRALEHRLSSSGARAQLLRGIWYLPGPGLEPVSPALAGGFSTTAPPRKPKLQSLLLFRINANLCLYSHIRKHFTISTLLNLKGLKYKVEPYLLLNSSFPMLRISSQIFIFSKKWSTTLQSSAFHKELFSLQQSQLCILFQQTMTDHLFCASLSSRHQEMQR